MMTGVVRWVFDIEGNRVHSIMGTGSVELGFFVDLNLRDALLVIVSLARKNLVELELDMCFILFRKISFKFKFGGLFGHECEQICLLYIVY